MQNLCICVCVKEKKLKAWKLLQSFFKRIRNVKLQNFLPKHPFSFTLETVLKMAEEINKRDVESICARVTKHASKKVAKAEVNLN